MAAGSVCEFSLFGSSGTKVPGWDRDHRLTPECDHQPGCEELARLTKRIAQGPADGRGCTAPRADPYRPRPELPLQAAASQSISLLWSAVKMRVPLASRTNLWKWVAAGS